MYKKKILKICLTQMLFGFVDTLPLFKSMFPGKSHSQERLYHDLVSGRYTAHSSLEDVKALLKMLSSTDISRDDMKKFSMTLN